MRLGQAGGRVGLVALLAEPVGHGGQDVPIVVHQQERALVLHAITLRDGHGREPVAPGRCNIASGCRQISTSQGDASQRAAKQLDVSRARLTAVATLSPVDDRQWNADSPSTWVEFRAVIPLSRGGEFVSSGDFILPRSVLGLMLLDRP